MRLIIWKARQLLLCFILLGRTIVVLASPNPKSVFVLQTSFPSKLILKNLGVFQQFESAVIRNTTARLLRWRPEGLEADLAESWSVSIDGKVITFNLRKDAFFSDGTPITASDVIWSVQRHFVAKGQHTEEFLRRLEGWEKLTSANSNIPGFTRVDDHTFQVKLIKPTPWIIPDFFGRLPASIFKKGNVPELEDKLPWDYVASGAYVISEHSAAEVQFRKNPYHWLGKNSLIPEKGILRVRPSGKDPLKDILSGELDYDGAASAIENLDLANLKKIGLQFIPQEPICHHLSPDFKGKILTKYPEFAAALNKFIDRDSLLNRLSVVYHKRPEPAYAWTAANTEISKEFPRFTDEEQKQALLRAKIKFPEIFNGKLTLTIAYAKERIESKALAEAIMESLNNFKITTLVKAIPFADIAAEQHIGDYDFAISSYNVSAFDPALTLPYLVGLDSRNINLPASHPVYSYKKRLEERPDLRGQLDMVREFNSLARKDGFFIPLFLTDSARIFSSRFDASRVPENTFYVYISDVRVKP